MGGQFQPLRMGALTQPYFGKGTGHGSELVCCAASRIGRGNGVASTRRGGTRRSSDAAVFKRRLIQYALSRPAAVSHDKRSLGQRGGMGTPSRGGSCDGRRTRSRTQYWLCSARSETCSLSTTARSTTANTDLRMAALAALSSSGVIHRDGSGRNYGLSECCALVRSWGALQQPCVKRS